MNILEERLVANVGDIVWFLRPQFTELDDEGCIKVYFSNQIEQGRIIRINTATECSSTMTVIDINNKQVGAVQEIFFKDFETALKALEKVKYKIFEGMDDYIKEIASILKYDFIVRCPYLVGDEVKITYDGIEYASKVHRFLYNKCDARYLSTPWDNKIEVQLLIEELRLIISNNNLDKLSDVIIEEVSDK